ncbi:PIN-like domain-containing protein [Kutzneria albida]|uniref:PIN like domain-containing protein n=1 Tax=Kutzneria albida DSM 43870 TaxID=1449976 RepID=W5WDP9_9PSEU|nr:PIN-like domain-containing protein [Kutzneria albida]AHH98671.1 hypothetical protein KALB_5309 [Kutzneria albida DSM 43870]
MTDERSDFLLTTLFQARLRPPGPPTSVEREQFFRHGLVVPDANVLLDLYRYTPLAREQVLALLRTVAGQGRLWVPYQVAAEFVRNRENVRLEQLRELSRVKRDIHERFDTAGTAIAKAAERVAHLLGEYAQDHQAGARLATEITKEAAKAQTSTWESVLCAHVTDLKNSLDVAVGTSHDQDPVFAAVAEILGDQIGAQPAYEVLRARVRDTVEYRYPNRIPPGFSDRGKGTDLERAGDFLLWAELLEKARGLPCPRRVLLVSRDTKEDWYELSPSGEPLRSLPALHEEMAAHSDATLLLQQPRAFLDGGQQFLNAEVSADTYEEVVRTVALDEVGEGVKVTESVAAALSPGYLVAEAQHTAGLVTEETHRALQVNSTFAWWLVWVTAWTGRRSPGPDEPSVSFESTTDSPENGAQLGWTSTEVPVAGGWAPVWIAPWLAAGLDASRPPDTGRLKRLIGEDVSRSS